MKIGLVTHPAKNAAREAATEIEQLGRKLGVDVSEIDTDAERPVCDLVVALGGDGTMLRAAVAAHRSDIPLVGVNLGHLGFLSAVGSDELATVMQKLVSGDYEIEHRMMLEAELSSSDAHLEKTTALNEVVLERGTLSRIVSIHVYVDDERVAIYSADGFIVSTPTGSTAYSLSAGGPILEPSMEAIILTSVSAHSPLWRSIVVKKDRTVRLELPHDAVTVSADGRNVATIDPGCKVSVRASSRSLKLIMPAGKRFYEKLRSRFQVESNR